jgi:hypothetical protein
MKSMRYKNPESIEFISLDNSGENFSLKSKIEAEGLNIQMEHTSPETPEQNGQVESSFATLWGRVRTMLNRSGVTQEVREKLWAGCALTATKLNNIMSRKDGKSAFQKYYGNESKITHNLKVFGEVGIKLSKIYGLPEKLSDKKNLCIMLGCPEDHPSDTYRVLDLKTQGVVLTRNVRWIGTTYGEYFGEKQRKIWKEQTGRVQMMKVSL